MVGRVSVETALDGPGRHLQRATTRRGLDRLEVQTVDGTWAYERFDLGGDLRLEGCFEPPFLAASCEVAAVASSSASHSCSLVSTSSRVSPRKRLCSASCRRVCSTAPGGITRVTVLPPTSRVSDQLGP
jgi:hypothetical protein